MESTILGAENLDLETAPNPICCGDSGGRAGCVTKPYKNYTVQILESELGLTHFCKAEANEIDFVPGPFRCQIEQQHLDFAVDSSVLSRVFRRVPYRRNLCTVALENRF